MGATGRLSFVFVMNVKYPSQLNGHQEGDPDGNLALGENWGKMAKSAKTAAMLTKLEPLIKVFRKLGASTPGEPEEGFLKGAFRTGGSILVKTGRSLQGRGFGVGDENGPKVFMRDVPFTGVGVEASLFFGVANFNVMPCGITTDAYQSRIVQ